MTVLTPVQTVDVTQGTQRRSGRFLELAMRCGLVNTLQNIGGIEYLEFKGKILGGADLTALRKYYKGEAIGPCIFNILDEQYPTHFPLPILCIPKVVAAVSRRMSKTEGCGWIPRVRGHFQAKHSAWYQTIDERIIGLVDVDTPRKCIAKIPTCGGDSAKKSEEMDAPEPITNALSNSATFLALPVPHRIAVLEVRRHLGERLPRSNPHELDVIVLKNLTKALSCAITNVAVEGESTKAAQRLDKKSVQEGLVQSASELRPWQRHTPTFETRTRYDLTSVCDKGLVSCEGLKQDLAKTLYKHFCRVRVRDMLRDVCPKKSSPAAGKKCNVYLDCLLEDLKLADRLIYRQTLTYLEYMPRGFLFEDQMCNCIIWSYGVRQYISYVDALEFAILSIHNKDVVKALSDLLKGTGCNCVFQWAAFVECVCLAGRGVDDLDLLVDATRRVEAKNSTVVDVDQEALERAIEFIFDLELGPNKVIKCDSAIRHWSRRFEWCVAGAHNTFTNDDAEYELVPPIGPGGARMNRRMAMEYTKNDPTPRWDGTIKVNVIPKLEQGKTRAIYACNTTSYIAFGRLLRPVERCWANKRVILDPGAGGNSGMFRRIRTAWPRNQPFSLMLDYADFNSQHSIESQQNVIRCLLRRVEGFSDDEGAVLLDSFNKTYIYKERKLVGKSTGTLMSGHRATSFINSVLNAAYLIVVMGREHFHRFHSFHVGDDVLCMSPDIRTCYNILEQMEKYGFTLQRSKQSVGYKTFEFLRMAGDLRAAHGYYARSVSSLVSGNWITEWQDNKRAALASMVQCCRSLINRSDCADVWRLVATSCMDRCGMNLDVLESILSGSCAVGNGPCYRGDGVVCYRELVEVTVDYKSREEGQYINYRNLRKYATNDYMSVGCEAIERKAMELTGVVPRLAALRSSYGGSVGYVDDASDLVIGQEVVCISVSREYSYYASTQEVIDNQFNTTRERGVLTKYPIICLMRNVLTVAQLQRLIAFETGCIVLEGVIDYAFGKTTEGVVIRGYIPYADAAALGSVLGPRVYRVLYPLRM